MAIESAINKVKQLLTLTDTNIRTSRSKVSEGIQKWHGDATIAFQQEYKKMEKNTKDVEEKWNTVLTLLQTLANQIESAEIDKRQKKLASRKK